MSKLTKTVLYAGALYTAYYIGKVNGYVRGALALLKAQQEVKEKRETEEKDRTKDIKEIADFFFDLYEEKANGKGNEKLN